MGAIFVTVCSISSCCLNIIVFKALHHLKKISNRLPQNCFQNPITTRWAPYLRKNNTILNLRYNCFIRFLRDCFLYKFSMHQHRPYVGRHIFKKPFDKCVLPNISKMFLCILSYQTSNLIDINLKLSRQGLRDTPYGEILHL